MPDTRIDGLIGLANRARKLTSGAFAVQKCIKSGKALLVLLDEGASLNTRSDLTGLCEKARVPLRLLPAGELERILGDYRICAALTDVNFARPLIERLN
ncbi:MAG: ribosomal L7Ae/L30e/S12e/Gadd45 family protein [Clostridia bacterium]|nr:ribosomal L7Ae/L30e/S12e/Gadd45 family protein [Clostridia bacterium]